MFAIGNMWPAEERPLIEEYPELISNRHIPLLKATIWMISIGATAVAVSLGMVLETKYQWRMYLPLALAILALVTHVVLRNRGPVAAMRLLALGGWGLATAGGFFAEGVRTPILLVYPMIVIFSGWILGARFGLGLFVASGIAIVAMAIGQAIGVVGRETPFPSAIMALSYLIVLTISIALTVYLLRSFRESYARYRLLTESIKDVVWIMDAETMHYRYISPSVEPLRGFTPEEMLAVPTSSAPVPETGGHAIDLIRARAQDLLAGKESPTRFYTDEVEQSRKDGSTVWTEVITSYYRNPESGRVEMRGVTRDISQRRRVETERAMLEAQLRESQKMEALGTLAGGVAHDFNNILAMILGNLELARQDVGQRHPALMSLDEIGKASRRAKDLVQQILAFGRRQTLERKATSLSLVVLESARLIRATLPAAVSLSVDCKADVPAVLADAGQVKQILLNLCQNALHAVQGQERPGAIGICLVAVTQHEQRGDLSPGRYACLSVRDNGSGMDEVTRAHIFEPFFTTKPKDKGTGLGLAVVHGIVKAHKAEIEVESTPGEGSAFRIYFPATEESVLAGTAPAANAATVPGKAKHLLYVDDEEAIVFLMKRLLERVGYRVSGYTDPQEALVSVVSRFDVSMFRYGDGLW